MSQLSQLVLNDNSDSQLANAVEKLSKSKRYREVVDDLAAFEAKAAADIEGLCDANHRVSIHFHTCYFNPHAPSVGLYWLGGSAAQGQGRIC